MRGMVALVGDDFVVEFNDSARAHGRAETASLAEELIHFDMSHIFPLISYGRSNTPFHWFGGALCSFDANFARAKVSQRNLLDLTTHSTPPNQLLLKPLDAIPRGFLRTS